MTKPFSRLRMLLGAKARRGMTLVEVLVGMSVGIVVLAGVYSLTYTGVLVAVKGFSINSTATAARNAVDQMQISLQSAYEQPTRIDSTGRALSGTTGACAGVKFYRYIGGPYVVKVPAAGLSGNATVITIVYDRRAQVVPPLPQENDALVINTTILMSREANQIRAYVSSAKVIANPSGEDPNRVTCEVTLQRALTGTAAVLPNDGTTLTALLVRPTAFVLREVGQKRELWMLESFPNATTINFTQARGRLLSDQIEEGDGAPGRLASGTPFEMVEINQRPFIRIDLQVRDQRYQNYLKGKQAADFATYVNLESRTAFKCDPNQL